jgi:glycosyltransferase involved in cell wall biosynthesis
VTVRAVAILCARNEEIRIGNALSDLIGEGLEVVLIDHDSTDRTVAIARRHLGRGLLGIERLPWTGRFSLDEQLEAKWRVIDQLDHDWVVHVDADEWLSAPGEGQTLLDGLTAVDAAGYNCVNFSEFVFIPGPGEDASRGDYRRSLTRYYFYQPESPFLLRAWKNRAGLENRRHAGHLLSGPARPFPQDFPMRHYICLSQKHAEEKYLKRMFDPAEVNRGWHRDRLLATKESLRFPGDDVRLRTLPHWSSKLFDRSYPVKAHFWEWRSPSVPDGVNFAKTTATIHDAADLFSPNGDRQRRAASPSELAEEPVHPVFDRASATALRALRAEMYRFIAKLEQWELRLAADGEPPVPEGGSEDAAQPARDPRAEYAREESLARLRILCAGAGYRIGDARKALVAASRASGNGSKKTTSSP